jgi:hypothetical protein
MRFESINLGIDFSGFAVTGGIASALAVAILAFNRRRGEYSWQVRSIVSAIAAMGFAPTIFRPIELPFIVIPAVYWIVEGFLEETELASVLKHGVLPWLITYALVYEIWKRCTKRQAPADGAIIMPPKAYIVRS